MNMRGLRQIMLIGCAMMALVLAAEQPDPVISSIRDAYQQAKESIKKNKSVGNEMVTKLDYTVRGRGKTTETLHFFYMSLSTSLPSRTVKVLKVKYLAFEPACVTITPLTICRSATRVWVCPPKMASNCGNCSAISRSAS